VISTHLLSSRLHVNTCYCRSRSYTGSATHIARGLYRRSGISPCPEDIRFSCWTYYSILSEKCNYIFSHISSIFELTQDTKTIIILILTNSGSVISTDRQRTCCFTGHRPNKLPWGNDESDPRCILLKAQIYETLEQAYADGYLHFICGMALGTDLYFCESALALRARHPEVTVEAAIPCEEQAANWRESERSRYYNLIAQCDLETMVQQHYDSACMHRRNRYMVDRSSRIISVFGGTLGGTMYTLSYALKQGLRLVTLDI